MAAGAGASLERRPDLHELLLLQCSWRAAGGSPLQAPADERSGHHARRSGRRRRKGRVAAAAVVMVGGSHSTSSSSSSTRAAAGKCDRTLRKKNTHRHNLQPLAPSSSSYWGPCAQEERHRSPAMQQPDLLFARTIQGAANPQSRLNPRTEAAFRRLAAEKDLRRTITHRTAWCMRIMKDEWCPRQGVSKAISPYKL